ncbi:MAG TPA: hypothetical protein PLD10_25990, partial [Rhodopila sp.]|nr:hypothetical protein [Rhodopila sp.]
KGRAYFSLLLEHYSLSTIELARELGVPLADKIVAVRQAESWWLHEYTAAIHTARVEYDEGIVELAQGRCGNHFFLYRFERRQRVKRRQTYFSNYGNGM